jgi:hypothetical protein
VCLASTSTSSAAEVLGVEVVEEVPELVDDRLFLVRGLERRALPRLVEQDLGREDRAAVRTASAIASDGRLEMTFFAPLTSTLSSAKKT